MNVIASMHEVPQIKLEQRNRLRATLDTYGAESEQYRFCEKEIRDSFILGVVVNSMRNLRQEQNSISLERHLTVLKSRPDVYRFYDDLAHREVATMLQHLGDSDDAFCSAMQAFNHQATEADLAFNRRVQNTERAQGRRVNTTAKAIALRTKLYKKNIDKAYHEFFSRTVSAVRKDLHFSNTEQISEDLDDLVAKIEGTSLKPVGTQSPRCKQQARKGSPNHGTARAAYAASPSLRPSHEKSAGSLNAAGSIRQENALEWQNRTYLFSKFRYHPRVLRWKTQDMRMIRAFTDFKQGEEVKSYFNNTDQQNQKLRRYHFLPGLVDLFEDPQLLEQFTFASKRPYALGMLAEFYHLSDHLPEYGVITLAGDPDKKLIYHSMFTPLTEEKHSYSETQDAIERIIHTNRDDVPIGLQEDNWHLGKATYKYHTLNILEVQFPGEQHFVRLHRVR